ncbi:MAG: hypothetical protein WAT71_15165 [Ignavibacteria bacterium]
MADNTCQDCDFPGNGKCSECNGTGYEGILDAIGDALTGQDQSCETCKGTGKCQTCEGKGYI